MPDWKPNLYLAFERERTQPSIDLVARMNMDAPSRIIDIGCGPGNITNILKLRWPEAKIIGIDNSEAMIKQAKDKYDGLQWILADTAGDLTNLGLFDIVFSNAAIQWMPDHPALLKNLYSIVKEGGVLAVQVPYTVHMPIHNCLQKLIAIPKWRERFSDLSTTHSVHEASYYYDILCELTQDFDLWETDYHHVMENHKALIKWYSGSGLRPYLDCLKDEDVKADFCNEFEMLLQSSYPLHKDGKVLFPFTRIFFTARKR